MISSSLSGKRSNGSGRGSSPHSRSYGSWSIASLCPLPIFLRRAQQNRYLSPLGYIVIIVCEFRFAFLVLVAFGVVIPLKRGPHPAFHDPWSLSVCNRYVLFPEALKIVTAFTIGGTCGSCTLPNHNLTRAPSDFRVALVRDLLAQHCHGCRWLPPPCAGTGRENR